MDCLTSSLINRLCIDFLDIYGILEVIHEIKSN